jgi:hypothetical protein
MYESNFHVTGFSYGSNIHDVVWRVSCNQAAFVVDTTAGSTCIQLAVTTSRWILADVASSQPSRPKFQHSSPTFGPWILAVAMGTSCWRVSLAVGNASMDETNTTDAATFFFTTDGKTFVPPFNCYIHNTNKC